MIFFIHACLNKLNKWNIAENCLKDIMSELQCEPELGGEGREQGGGEDTGQEEGGREEQEGLMREEPSLHISMFKN